MLITALFIVPFFSVKADNIFDNGNIFTLPPDEKLTKIVEDSLYDTVPVGIELPEGEEACQYVNGDLPEPHFTADYEGFSDNGSTETHYRITCTYGNYDYSYNPETNSQDKGDRVGELNKNIWIQYRKEITSQCPPQEGAYNYPVEHMTYPVNIDENGRPSGCADPVEIQMKDSCKATSQNTVLNIQITDSVGCYSQPDGSVCEYRAVDVGNGNQVYEMNLEGDCYSQNWPMLDENGVLGELPIDQACVTSGGITACPEDPENVCDAQNQCDVGCGYVEGQFLCFTTEEPDPEEPDPEEPDPEEPDPEEPDPEQPDNLKKDDQGNLLISSPEMTAIKNMLAGKCEDGQTDCVEGLGTREKGSFDIDAAQQELEQMKADYQNYLTQIKNESATIIPAINGAASNFSSCHDIIQANGKKFNKCTNQFSDELVILSNALLFIFTAAAAFIVLGGLKRRE